MGLHAVRYMVIDPSAGAVLSVAEDKLEALASARKVLKAADALAARNDGPSGEQALLWPDENLRAIDVAGALPKAVPRRRREVFEKSAGHCHYCRTVLTLDGKWHVEHMLPRALDGSDECANGKTPIPVWAPACLGAMQDLARLHAKYIALKAKPIN